MLDHEHGAVSELLGVVHHFGADARVAGVADLVAFEALVKLDGRPF